MVTATDTSSAHTSLPWKSQEAGSKLHIVAMHKTEYPKHEQRIATLSSIDPVANARHIVKCVNMHDEFVGLLKEYLESSLLNEEKWTQKVTEIIARAKGE